MFLKKMLGEILLNQGLVSSSDLDQALDIQKESRQNLIIPERLTRSRLISEARLAAKAHANSQLGAVLIEMGLVSQEQIEDALAEQEDSLSNLGKLNGNKLAAIMEICSIVNSSLNLVEVLQLIMNFSNQVTKSVGSTLMLLDDVTGELVFSVPTGPKSQELQDIRLPQGQGIAGWVAQNQRPLRVDDASQDQRFFSGMDRMTGFETKSVLAVPLKAKHRLIGVLEVVNKVDGSPFSKEDELFLLLFGSQAALAIENARLYGEMQERMRKELDLQRRLDEAEKLRALGLMASGVSHNFNNLLTVILGNAEMIEIADQGGRVSGKLQAIQKAALEGASIVQRILSFSKSHDDERNMQKVFLKDLVKECIGMTEPVWKGKAQSEGVFIAISASFHNDTNYVRGDEGALKEVLVNLIFNAVDAMPDGGKIEISTYERGDQLCVAVRDNGIGMTAELQKRIFDPFFSTKGVGHTGLGMSSAHGIMRNHQGNLEVQSKLGEGSSITMVFPQNTAAGGLQDDEGKAGDITPMKVLVVDDEEAIGAYVHDALTRNGHQVALAVSGPQGLELLDREEFDLLLSDLVMPQMSGWEMIERAKAIKPELTVGLMTGWDVSDAELAERQVDFIVRKPFKISSLLQALAKGGK